ncbi:hypothetical protein Tco_1346906 [Tanacetum coccineum]
MLRFWGNSSWWKIIVLIKTMDTHWIFIIFLGWEHYMVWEKTEICRVLNLMYPRSIKDGAVIMNDFLDREEILALGDGDLRMTEVSVKEQMKKLDQLSFLHYHPQPFDESCPIYHSLPLKLVFRGNIDTLMAYYCPLFSGSEKIIREDGPFWFQIEDVPLSLHWECIEDC